jgi:murein DD-endopeptidase MepM/ murein hydrolase activator NlpD
MFAVVLVGATLVAGPAQIETSISGSIEASLVREAPEDGPAIAAQVARLLRWRGDVVQNVQPRDRLNVVYSEGEEPELLAMAYRGSQIELEAYRFEASDGVARYYDAKGELVEPRMVNSPVPGYVQITEVPQRGRGKRRHKGIDLKAPEGAPVLLPFDGTVVRVNWLTRVNGNCIELRLRSGMVARFLHLQEVDPAVKPGRKLRAGTRLGAVGSTGRSSAPHLHYELRRPDGRVLDPLEVHGTEPVTITPTMRAAFDRLRATYGRELRVTTTARNGATR